MKGGDTMRLNPDCIRDILLIVEENVTPNQLFCYSQDSNYEILCQYNSDEISYHLGQCNQSEFFYRFSEDMCGDVSVVDLTPKAHEFLANIRQNDTWSKVKDISKSIGIKSLSGLAQISTAIVTEIIKARINQL